MWLKCLLNPLVLPLKKCGLQTFILICAYVCVCVWGGGSKSNFIHFVILYHHPNLKVAKTKEKKEI